MTDVAWTTEQEAVLASTSRVSLIRASPGSGKTKIFVEFLNRHLASWSRHHQGIAALSFTNVAQGEIVDRLGGRLPAPHFVGTLDSFFLRFVVGPFGHLAGIRAAGARLVPSPLDDELREPILEFQTASKSPQRIPLFRIGPSGGTEDAPNFAVRPYYGGPAQALPADMAAHVLRAKKSEWRTRGRITHADSHYVAAVILRGLWGDAIRRLVARRFPVFLVDELQDTGHFLGRALLSLLAHKTIKAVLVGDEDQRIFGFSGVDPKLFAHVADIGGCGIYTLRTTQRCAVRVAAVASALSRSRASVEPKEGSKDGVAMLLVHDDAKGSHSAHVFQRATDLCRMHGSTSLAILVRKRDDKRHFLTSELESSCPLQASGPVALHKAVIRLIEGRGDLAAKLVESRLGHLRLKKDMPHRDDLEEAKVDPTEFRRLARRIVLQAARFTPGETWGQWRDRMKELLRQSTSDLGGSGFSGSLGGMFKSSNSDKPDLLRVRHVDAPALWNGVDGEVCTVHEAKGREFDAVLFYCPKPSRHKGLSTCPSETWWLDAADSEEREVAFVAVTRARHLVILAVHSETLAALQEKRPDFVALFNPAEQL